MNASSVASLPRPRIRAMTAERFDFEKTSATMCAIAGPTHAAIRADFRPPAEEGSVIVDESRCAGP